MRLSQYGAKINNPFMDWRKSDTAQLKISGCGVVQVDTSLRQLEAKNLTVERHHQNISNAVNDQVTDHIHIGVLCKIIEHLVLLPMACAVRHMIIVVALRIADNNDIKSVPGKLPARRIGCYLRASNAQFSQHLTNQMSGGLVSVNQKAANHGNH
jgi:hypothetical protein